MIGWVLAVPTAPVVHEGIMVGWDGRGQPLVASASGKRGEIVVENLDGFSSGRPGLVAVRGYYGNLHPMEVRARALSQLGRSYSVFRRNCEHFTRFAHGVPVRSPQLVSAGASAALASVGCLALAVRLFA